jgi:hypothetical protein
MSIKHEMQDQKARQRNKDGSPGQKLSKARNRKRRIPEKTAANETWVTRHLTKCLAEQQWPMS